MDLTPLEQCKALQVLQSGIASGSAVSGCDTLLYIPDKFRRGCCGLQLHTQCTYVLQEQTSRPLLRASCTMLLKALQSLTWVRPSKRLWGNDLLYLILAVSRLQSSLDSAPVRCVSKADHFVVML